MQTGYDHAPTHKDGDTRPFTLDPNDTMKIGEDVFLALGGKLWGHFGTGPFTLDSVVSHAKLSFAEALEKIEVHTPFDGTYRLGELIDLQQRPSLQPGRTAPALAAG